MSFIKHKYQFLYLGIFAIFFVLAIPVQAATLKFVPESKNFGVGEVFTVDVKVDTADASINAAQATVQFPKGVLQLLSVDRQASAFGFWVEDPVISNEAGTLQFIGGSAKGISGKSLQILKMKFKASGTGVAEITASDAAVTSNDGNGTNVLETIESASVVVGTKGITPPLQTIQTTSNPPPQLPHQFP